MDKPTEDKVDNKILTDDQTITDADGGSFGNKILWFLGVTSFIGSTLVNQHLPAYWEMASSIWVRIAATLGLIVLGTVFLLSTTHGKGFSTLLKDVQVELRRVSWPAKEETTEYTWKVLLAIFIAGILIYILDGLSSLFGSPFIN